MITEEIAYLMCFIIGMLTWAVIMDGPHRDKRRKTDHRAQKPQVQQLQRAPNCQGIDDDGRCLAVQHSDQMSCPCGNVWDMNDPEPPECPPGRFIGDTKALVNEWKIALSSKYGKFGNQPERFAPKLQTGKHNPSTNRILTCPHGKEFPADKYEVGELCPCNFGNNTQ